MLHAASMQRAALLRRSGGPCTRSIASFSAHQLLVLLSHSFHPQPCPRHQRSLSASSSPHASLLPSSQPAVSSPRLLSSLATRPLPSGPPLALPASSPPTPSFASLLDGEPLPTSSSAVRDLLDRLRPLLYLELSRLSSRPSSLTATATATATAAAASASNDWLSAVDVDVICSHVLALIRAQHRSVTSREVVRLTVAAITEQMRAADEVGRVVDRERSAPPQQHASRRRRGTAARQRETQRGRRQTAQVHIGPPQAAVGREQA